MEEEGREGEGTAPSPIFWPRTATGENTNGRTLPVTLFSPLARSVLSFTSPAKVCVYSAHIVHTRLLLFHDTLAVILSCFAYFLPSVIYTVRQKKGTIFSCIF